MAADDLRNNKMMAHLMDALDEGRDIGHYGRLTFAMVARHFLSDDEVVEYLRKDNDFTAEDAQALLEQVASHGYNPPRRERILEWQQQQDFPIIPDADDPDAGNVYADLDFPDEVYQHIEEYHKQKAHR